MRRMWWIFGAIGLLAGLIWLAMTQSQVGPWLVSAAWVSFAVAFVVQRLLPRDRGKRVRAAAQELTNGFDEVQGLYLGRPALGPVAFGRTGPTDTVLVVDRRDEDPADLR